MLGIQTVVDVGLVHILKVRAIQDFISELTSLDLTKEDALQRLTQRGFDPETLKITQIAVEEYFKGIEAYRVYDRSFFLKEITKREAELLFTADKEVYELYDDGTEGLIESREHFDEAEVYGVSIKEGFIARQSLKK